jgi:hypothetical protein
MGQAEKCRGNYPIEERASGLLFRGVFRKIRAAFQEIFVLGTTILHDRV